MKLGGLDIADVKIGGTQVDKVYQGDNLVWQFVFVPDVDYQAILDYATTQGYTLPSISQQIKQNKLLVDLKNAGVWSKLDTFAVLATDGDSDFSLIDWKRLSQMTAVNSPTFTTNQGFTGNGTSAYINTNFRPLTNGANISRSSASFGFYIYNNIIQDKGYGAIGYYMNPTTATVAGVSLIRSIFIGPGVNAGSHTGRNGLFQVDRNNLTSVYHIKNGVELANPNTNASASVIDTNLYLLAYPNAEFNLDTVSMYFAGASLYSEKLTINNIWNNYINSI